MSAYAIFMAPIAGVLFADYWIIKKRKYDVPALYDPRGIYRYNKYGINWRALVVLILTIVPLLPALAKKVTPQNVQISEGLQNLFTFNWLYGFFLSIVLYYVLNVFFPHQETLIGHVIDGYGSTVVGVEQDAEHEAAEEKEVENTSQKKQKIGMALAKEAGAVAMP